MMPGQLPSATGVVVTPTRADPIRSDSLRRPVLAVLTGGVLLGLAWRVLAPWAAERSDRGESEVAADGTFFLLALTAGLLTAAVLWRRPGRRPARRLIAVLLASAAAGLLAAGMGRFGAGPVLHAWGGVLLWPLATALVSGITVFVQMLFGERW